MRFDWIYDEPDLSDELKDMVWSYLDCRPHIPFETALEDCRNEIEWRKSKSGSKT